MGRFTFVQIAAPSRSSIGQYQEFEKQVRALAEQINERFGKGGHAPIVLKIEHHEPVGVYQYYRAANVCFVSSLHDGMNLVAKEFVAARDDEQGVLILSQFAGASREMPEALIVNPYDTDQFAAALHVGLTMPAPEQRDRMRIMRSLISEFNVYRWAGRMLLDAAAMRKRGRLARASAGATRHSVGTAARGGARTRVQHAPRPRVRRTPEQLALPGSWISTARSWILPRRPTRYGSKPKWWTW